MSQTDEFDGGAPVRGRWGRPKGSGQGYTKAVYVRMKPEMWSRIEAQAVKRGIPAAKLIRRWIAGGLLDNDQEREELGSDE